MKRSYEAATVKRNNEAATVKRVNAAVQCYRECYNTIDDCHILPLLFTHTDNSNVNASTEDSLTTVFCIAAV